MTRTALSRAAAAAVAVATAAATAAGCRRAPPQVADVSLTPVVLGVTTVSNAGFAGPENIVYDSVADVFLVSNDGDFVDQVEDLLDGRRVGLVGFTEFRNRDFVELTEDGLEMFDLEYDVQAFNERLPRVRIIPIEEFDPVQFL